MNLTLFTTFTLTIATLVAAAPVPAPDTSRRELVPGLPTPMDVIEMMYPHSGIPELASKVEGVLEV